MKIILCKSQIYGPISGSDETLVTYATQLRKAGHSVSVLLMYLQAEEDQYYQRLLEAEVPVSWIASNLAHTSMGAGRKLAYKMFRTFPNSRQFIRRRTLRVETGMARRYYQRCRTFIDEQNADLIHVMTPDPGAMVMIRAAHDEGCPLIYQELGIPYQPPAFEYCYEQFTSVLPLCSEITALSPTLLQQCREKLSGPKALSILPVMSGDFANGRAPHRPSPDKITFGFAARMEELKGPMVLIEAFAVAHQQCGHISLNMAGDGSQRQRLAARAKALNVASRYRYHGVYTHPEDCRAFMESLDVFVMPSFSEGTPNSVVEAMACGKPIASASAFASPGGTSMPDSSPIMSGMPPTSVAMTAKAQYERFFSPKVVVPLILETYRRVTRNGHGVAETVSGNGHLHPWANISSK